jgi:4-diphosphocytidyl-2-C-methyl-D-erythritol kinase
LTRRLALEREMSAAFSVSATLLTLPAYAKINILLRVLGRRADNFHEIFTVFQTVTLHDRLTFEPLASERVELECSAPEIPSDETNLVHRAATALRERFGVRRGARIRLEKRIPSEGGLGGGSSDAAVALMALASLWQIRTDKAELALLGARLGADVPFFLTGGTALGTGLGTEIRALDDIAPQHLLIVTPGVGVSSAEAYKSLDAPALTKAETTVNLPISRAGGQISDSLCEVVHNDFEPSVFRLRPEIKRAHEALIKNGAQCALLAGSGSSVFGIFDKREAAASAEVALGGETRWQVFACETLTRDDYRQSLEACAAFL